MKDQTIEKLIEDSMLQISDTYRKLADLVNESDAQTDDAIAAAMANMGIAENAEAARTCIHAVKEGINSAEDRLNARQPSPEAAPAASLREGFPEGESPLSALGLLVGLRETLLEFAGNGERNLPEEAQSFSQQSEEEQLRTLSILYRRALEKSAEVGLRKLDRITGGASPMGKGTGGSRELLCAISLAAVIQKNGKLLDPCDVCREAGAITHSAICLTDKNEEKLRVDPVLGERAIEIGAIVISIAVTALFAAVTGYTLGDLTSAAAVLEKLNSVGETGNRIISGQEFLKEAKCALEGMSNVMNAVLPFVLEPVAYRMLQQLNEILTERKQRDYDRKMNLTEEEKDLEAGRKIRMASLMY